MDDYFSFSDDVLGNKLGITNKEELRKAEADICYIRQIEAENMTLPNEFDFLFLLFCHKCLFDDIYAFAGKVRTVNLTKGNTPFCYVQNIEAEQRRIFVGLKSENYLVELTKDTFLDRLAYYSSELNALHPFREGNGRSIRLYLRLLAKSCGYSLQFQQCTADDVMKADIQAFYGNINPLIALYHRIAVHFID